MGSNASYFGSREVEQFLVGFLGISAAGESAFAGRMKHLIRQKFPAGVDTGRGVPARYHADEFFQVIVVVELWQWGVPPARATKLVADAWPALRESIRTVWNADKAAHDGTLPTAAVPPIFWRVPVEALDYLVDQHRPWRTADADKMLVLTQEARERLESEQGKFDWRVAYIEADKMLKEVFTYMRNSGRMNLSSDRIDSLMSTLRAADDEHGK